MGSKQVLEVEGKKLTVSNLEKVMFPETGFTKGDLIHYYIRVAPWLLPHLRDRPLTLKRYPDGIRGEHFYEKNAPSHKPEWVPAFPIPRSEGGPDIQFVLLNDLPSLVWAVNLANIEMHTFLARAPKVHSPTTIVFDLDPGAPADVLECAQVALILKVLFERMRLKSFIKSSGSKGLQLYLPLNGKADYSITQPFAKVVASSMAQKFPELVVADMTKSLRTGKVLIDWSQNSEHKTTVNAYSLRGKSEKPYVSMPLEWDEVERGWREHKREIFYFDPETALSRLQQKGDIFAPVLELQQAVPENGSAVLKHLEEIEMKTQKKPVRKRKGPPASDRSLTAYRKKRDFNQTTEPEAEVKPSHTGGLMYVIQKHAASHLHYDFRLEMEGVLRSWAVPKGVPYTRGEKRLAMHVEDHPMDYARFEGTIPAGNYGGGTVMVWDIGQYTVMDGDYRKGKLHMMLTGKKLNGEWILVKTRTDQSGKESWLLIKGGENMKPLSVKNDDSSALTGRSMEEIGQENKAQWISNRESGSDSSTRKPPASTKSSVKKRGHKLPGILDDLPPSKDKFVEPMHCKLVNELPEGEKWIYEVKLDGYRCIGFKSGDKTELWSRRGADFSKKFAAIHQALVEWESEGFCVDGEVVALDAKGKPSFQLLQNSAQKNVSLQYYIFDLLSYRGKDITGLPLKERRELLESVLPAKHPVLHFSSALNASAHKVVEAVQKQGFEGVVAKRISSSYQPGKRSGDWVKFKINAGQEMVIGGYIPGRNGFDSILVGYFEGKKFLFAGKVKNGFVARTQKELFQIIKPLEQAACPFSNLPEKKGGRWAEGLTTEEMAKCNWVKPKVVCQVEFTEWTDAGHLRHSKYLGLREDKEAKEVVREGARA